ncbi:MAG: response regulator transcription factor [Rhodocyclaceae bacterium]|nr:response regulator transcription factor [Rhodocyclaceae bacterium]
MVTALIADDERLMREQLAGRLAQVWPELEIVALATNGKEAVKLADEKSPQIAFLDIRMPGISGIEVAAQLDDNIHVVFVTAYDEYAIDAFDRGAIDYLLKPVDPERLARTVSRLKTALERSSPTPREGEVWATLLEKLRENAKPPASGYLQWIQASIGERLEFIATSEVLFFQAADKYTRVVRASGEALIRKPIYELVGELDPEQFWQIHRSSLVNVKAIQDVTRDIRGHLMIRLKGIDERVEVSRSYSHRFKQM